MNGLRPINPRHQLRLQFHNQRIPASPEEHLFTGIYTNATNFRMRPVDSKALVRALRGHMTLDFTGHEDEEARPVAIDVGMLDW